MPKGIPAFLLESAGAVAADIPVCCGGRHLAARINARFSGVPSFKAVPARLEARLHVRQNA